MATISVANEQHMPLARSELLAEGLEEGFAEGPEENPGSEVSWRLGRIASRRMGALCAAVVLGAIVVLRGTGPPPRLVATKESSPKSILAADDCAACDDAYSKGSGVIADPTALGGAMTYEDVQKAMHATCPEHCTKKKKDDKAVFRGFGGSGDDDEDEWSQAGGEDEWSEVLEDDDGTPCHTAERGEMCYDLVTYTVRKLLTNSDFYLGLTPESTEAQVQRRLHEDRPGICHRPCVDDEKENHTSKADKKEAVEGSGDDGKCKNAEPGDDCFGVILWVLTEGVFKHPKWFLGLNQASSMEAVQRHLHTNPEKGMPTTCREPCEETCRDAFEGEPCYDSVTWAMDEGISNHSDWFLGLVPDSKFAEVQMHFHSNPNATVYCPKPCNVCHTAVEGEDCYNAVAWVMEDGMVKHPESYKGLTRMSSFQEVQDHLHRNKSERKAKCVKPCPVAQEGVEDHAPVRLLATPMHHAPAALS